jgi:riboflavin kinase/FMN adenylyltransferase
MQIIHNTDRSPLFEGAVVTLGNFDGIHLGHQALIGGTVGDAKRLGLRSVVLTFEPHPIHILAPGRAPKLILTHQDKMQSLQGFGVDAVVVQPFDLEFARREAKDFVRDLLLRKLGAKKIWAGRDLRFGRGRKGSVEDLILWGRNLGFQVAVVEPILVRGERVSSSKIRELVSDGRVDEVHDMLGRYHFISGDVVEGHGRGRELGFPTANIAPATELLPADGIYATLFHTAGQAFPSVSSIGRNPTFGGGPRTVETFVLDFDRNLYGAAIRLSFIKRLRDELKFAAVSELVAQIAEDVRCAEAIFRQLGIEAGPSSLP